MKRILSIIAIVVLSIFFILNCSPSITEPGSLPTSWKIRLDYLGWEEGDFVFQGGYSDVAIILDSMPKTSIDGFNFLIAYDKEALTFMKAELTDATNCWHYFFYEQGPFDNSGFGHVRLSGLRDVNYGPYKPQGCEGASGHFNHSGVELVNLLFYVTDDREYDCAYTPVYFYWILCSDNTIMCGGNEDELVSRGVYELSWESGQREDVRLIPPSDIDMSRPNIYGEPNGCNSEAINAAIDFYNGGLDIACASSIENPAGDLNQNRIPYEEDDINLFADYFAFGNSVFTIDSIRQRAASDVNNDRESLTPADLVYMIRFAITGDYIASSHLQHLKDTVKISNYGNKVSVEASNKVAALWLVFEDSTDVTLLDDNMNILTGYVNEETRVLIYGPDYIPTGTSDILLLNNDLDLIHAEASGYYGNRLVTIIESTK